MTVIACMTPFLLRTRGKGLSGGLSPCMPCSGSLAMAMICGSWVHMGARFSRAANRHIASWRRDVRRLHARLECPALNRSARRVGTDLSVYAGASVVCGQRPDFGTLGCLDLPRRRRDRINPCGEDLTGAGEHFDYRAVDEHARGRAAGCVVERVMGRCGAAVRGGIRAGGGPIDGQAVCLGFE